MTYTSIGVILDRLGVINNWLVRAVDIETETVRRAISVVHHTGEKFAVITCEIRRNRILNSEDFNATQP